MATVSDKDQAPESGKSVFLRLAAVVGGFIAFLLVVKFLLDM